MIWVLDSICTKCISSHVINGLVPFGPSVINLNNTMSLKTGAPFTNMVYFNPSMDK